MTKPADTITTGEWETSALEAPLARLKTQWPWRAFEVEGQGGATRLAVTSERGGGCVELFRDHLRVWWP